MRIFGHWLMSGEMRRWRREAEEAITVPERRDERAFLALELAARFASAHSELGIVGLEQVIDGMIENSWLEAMRAAQHLDKLREWVERAEYEDVGEVARESAWSEHYLLPVLLKPLKMRLQRPAAYGPDGWSERLFGALADQISPWVEVVLAA